MGITSIQRDWGDNVAIVRIKTTDTLADVSVSGYLASQSPNIESFNKGPFNFLPSDFVLVMASNGFNFFNLNSTFTSLTVAPIGTGGNPGTVTSILTGTGLTGGPITSTGTISLEVPVTATNGGTGVESPTAHTIPVAGGSSAFTFLGPLTNGQLLIGSTGSNPVVASLTAGTNITITPGNGTITIDASGGGSSPFTFGEGTDSAVGGDGTATAPGNFSLSYGDTGTSSGMGNNNFSFGTSVTGSTGNYNFIFGNQLGNSLGDYNFSFGNATQINGSYNFSFGLIGGGNGNGSFVFSSGQNTETGSGVQNDNCFSFGASANCFGLGSFALGGSASTTTNAMGDYSFSFGMSTTANNNGSWVINDSVLNPQDTLTGQFVAGFTGGYALYGGSLNIETAGSGLAVAEGANCKQGVATLTAGTVTVSNASVTSTSRIFLVSQDNGVVGALRAPLSSIVPGTSFVINSSVALDAGVVCYEIFEAAS